MSVISFSTFKSVRQLKSHREELVAVLQNVRETLTRLFEAHLVFATEGSRAARDLLEAQEDLATALDVLDSLADDTDERNADALRVHALLTHTGELATRAMQRLQAMLPASA